MSMDLEDSGNEDLIKKNKKRKPLGCITARVTMSPMTKEEYNEVICQSSQFMYEKSQTYFRFCELRSFLVGPKVSPGQPWFTLSWFKPGD